MLGSPCGGKKIPVHSLGGLGCVRRRSDQVSLKRNASLLIILAATLVPRLGPRLQATPSSRRDRTRQRETTPEPPPAAASRQPLLLAAGCSLLAAGCRFLAAAAAAAAAPAAAATPAHVPAHPSLGKKI